MKIEIEIEDPAESGLPGLARYNLAQLIGWDRVRELFPKETGK